MFGIIDIMDFGSRNDSRILGLERPSARSVMDSTTTDSKYSLLHGLRAVLIAAKCSDRFPDL